MSELLCKYTIKDGYWIDLDVVFENVILTMACVPSAAAPASTIGKKDLVELLGRMPALKPSIISKIDGGPGPMGQIDLDLYWHEMRDHRRVTFHVLEGNWPPVLGVGDITAMNVTFFREDRSLDHYMKKSNGKCGFVFIYTNKRILNPLCSTPIHQENQK